MLILGGQTPTHPLDQDLGDRKPEACGASRGIDRIKAVKKLFHVHRRQGVRRIGKHDAAVLAHTDTKISVGIFYRIAHDVAKNARKCRGI